MPCNPVSVLLCTYRGDNPDHLKKALQSVFSQTVVPEEVLTVADGPLNAELEAILDGFQDRYPDIFKTHRIPKNVGLGAALRAGVESCSHDLIARMDADDIAVEDRFEQQLQYMNAHPDVDVLGGYVTEFTGSPSSADPIRSVPTDQDNLRSAARFRCPVNHPTVMFRKQSVIGAGNYRPFRSMQDYELWMRMLSQGYTIENVPDVLVKCRASNDLYQRRGGLSYARLEIKLQYEFLRLGMTSPPVFLFNLVCRLPIRLMPNGIRSFVYRTVLRD